MSELQALRGEDFVVFVDDLVLLFPNPNFLCKMEISVVRKTPIVIHRLLDVEEGPYLLYLVRFLKII